MLIILARSGHLSIISIFLKVTLRTFRTGKSTIRHVCFSFLWIFCFLLLILCIFPASYLFSNLFVLMTLLPCMWWSDSFLNPVCFKSNFIQSVVLTTTHEWHDTGHLHSVSRGLHSCASLSDAERTKTKRSAEEKYRCIIYFFPTCIFNTLKIVLKFFFFYKLLSSFPFGFTFHVIIFN